MLRKIASLGALQLVGILINIIRAKTFAVLLGPAGLGIVGAIDQLIMSTVQIANFSLPFTALKFLSRSHSHSEEQFRRTYSAFAKAIGMLAIIATIVAVIVVPPTLDHLDSQIAAYRAPVTIALLGIPATMMLIFLGNVLAARQESAGSVILIILSAAVLLFAGVTGCLIGGISGIYFGTVLASTLLVIACFCFLWKRRNLPFWINTSGVWKDCNRNSEILWIAFFLFFAAASSGAQLFLVRYAAITRVSTEAAGFLHACLAVALSIGAVLGPANAQYFRPYVNREIPATEKFAAADRFLPRLLLFYCLGALVVLLFPELVLRVLFSSEFIPAVSVLCWFVVWQCLYQCCNVYQELLLGLDDAKGYALVATAGNLTAAALSTLLASRFSLLGIAVGFIVGALVTMVLTDARLRSKHGLAIPLAIAVSVMYAIAGMILVAMAGRLSIELSLVGLIARGLTGIIFLAGLWFILPRPVRVELSSAIASRWHAS